MAEPGETVHSGGDEVQQARQEAQKEIKAARANKSGDQLSIAEKQLAQKYLQELAEKSTAASEVRDMAKATGGLSVEGKRKEAVEVKKTVVKVLEAIKQGVVKAKANASQKVLAELAERAGLMTDTTASYLYPLIDKYIYRDIFFSKPGQELTGFEKDFKKLYQDNPIAAKLLGQIIYDRLGEISTVTKDELIKQLEIKIDDEGKFVIPEEEVRNKLMDKLRREQEDENRRRSQTTQEQAEEERKKIELQQEIYTLQQLIRDFELYLTPEYHKFIIAISAPEKFISYIDEIKSEAIEKARVKGKALSEKEAYSKASEIIEERLVDVLDKILARFTETSPEKFWQEVGQENFVRGINTTLATFGSYLDKLRTALEEYERDNPDQKIKLTKSVGLDPIIEDIVIEYKDENGDTVYVDKPRIRYRPLSKPEDVNLSGFASYLRLMTDEYIGEREYLHNARSILTHPKDPERGFYAQLGQYAERMKTPALEEMFLFPNADLLQDAINLYEKFSEEQFASQDWIHATDMFLNKTGTVMTRLEEEVLEALKRMHPKLKSQESKLKSALFMAIGAQLRQQ